MATMGEPLREPPLEAQSTFVVSTPSDERGALRELNVEGFLERFAPGSAGASHEARQRASERALRAAEHSGRSAEVTLWLIRRERAALEGPVENLERRATRLLEITRQPDVVSALDVADACCGAWAPRSGPRHLVAQEVGAAAADFTQACTAMVRAAGVESLGEALDVVDGLLRGRLTMFDRQ
jgi:hypothetical protein